MCVIWVVGKGFSQRSGAGHDETYSPVVKYYSLWVILAINAAADLELFQLYVTTAFLYDLLIEEIYLEQPRGHVISRGEQRVLTPQQTLRFETGLPELE